MRTTYQRQIKTLRISVTQRCNLRCEYCTPGAPNPCAREKSEPLSLDEFLLAAKAAASLGIESVRITGGEPLLRDGVAGFAAGLHTLGFSQVNLTTNGTLLPGLAPALRQAGIHSLNIGINTLRADRYTAVTRGGRLSDALRGIDAALCAGFDRVKLNVVLMRGVNDDEIEDFVALARENPLYVRFIELMPLGEGKGCAARYMPGGEVLLKYPALVPDAETGAGPARYYHMPGLRGKIGLIAAVSGCFCERCGRLRLTADGKLLPCLFSVREIDLLPALRPYHPQALGALFEKAAMQKPERRPPAQAENGRVMSRIGG